MALLDKGLKQRMVGALVLIALAVIFLPMLLTRQDERASVEVDVPTAPVSPGMPQAVAPPVDVPVVSEPVPSDPEPLEAGEVPPAVVDQPVAAQPTEVRPTAAQPTAARPIAAQPVVAPPTPPQAKPEARLDEANLPVSWSVQLASLSSRPNAENLQKTLRSQGYNAYIRHVEGMNRVFVGPVIERKEADRLRDQLSRQQKLNGIVVRFQPERS